MEKSKKSLLLRCAIYAVILSLGGAIILSGYVYSVVSELKLKIHNAKISKHAFELAPSKLEQDSQVKAGDLKAFLLFSKNTSVERFLDESQLILEGTLYRVAKETELPALESNSCQKINCIQIKKEFEQIPSSIWKGLLGTEDFRFLEHRGVDVFAIARAIVVDIIAMKFVQGGSTLTQQLMKNLFLTNERKLSRKFKEMIYSLYIENVLEKEDIITLYLNEMFWGTHQGVYIKGFYAASLVYFQKPPKALSDYEATFLISLLKGPGYYNPKNGIERIKTRTRAVYSRLKGLDLVTKNEKVIWSDAKWDQYHADLKQDGERDDFLAYFLVSSNYDIFLEPFEKFVLFKSYLYHKNRLSSVVGDADIGIKFLIASDECQQYDCGKTFSFYSKFEREKRKAITEEAHQVGSLFKPIVYDTFIDFGRSYDEEISTDPITLNLKSGKWRPKDYSKAKIDKISLKVALQKSKNIPLVKVANEIGFDELEKKLVNKIPRLKLPLKEYPAQLLGAIELTMEEVMTTYVKFLKNKCDDVSKGKEQFDKSILYYMSTSEETTISKLAKPPLKHALVFGKTGTSNKGLDNWYFAYDGTVVYVLWYGVESKRDEVSLRLSGATTSFQIFQDFINFRGKQVAEIYCQN